VVEAADLNLYQITLRKKKAPIIDNNEPIEEITFQALKLSG